MVQNKPSFYEIKLFIIFKKKEKVLYFSLRDIFVLESPDHIARDIVSSSPSSELD